MEWPLLGAAPLLPAGEGTRFSGDGVAFGSAGEEDAFESGGGVTTSGAFDTGFRIALRELVEVGLAGGGGCSCQTLWGISFLNRRRLCCFSRGLFRGRGFRLGSWVCSNRIFCRGCSCR